MRNVKRIATKLVDADAMRLMMGTKEYKLTDRKTIHAMIDVLLDDGAIFRVSGNNGGANITVQFHSDEHRDAVDDLLTNLTSVRRIP